jgi:aspartyl-tRNA(Asn)/glutamyl-tRNA(Gln) amidotransferase subunit C
VSVKDADVRHIAALARLGLDEGRIPSLVAELNGILAHMAVLSAVDTSAVDAAMPVTARGQAPLRRDSGEPIPLARSREEFAPQMRDGFFVVPRLSTHEDAEEATA